MPTFYRSEGESTWKPLGDDVDLEAWATKELHKYAYQDSDGGYSHYIEFDRNGERTYARAYYNGWHNEDEDDNGALSEVDYGTEEHMKKWHGKYAVSRYPYSPYRDYLLVGSYGKPGNKSYASD